MKKLLQIITRILKEQSGVSMILVSLGMFMLIGFTAFVVDVGSLYFEKSRLQKALDAAVLAGAQSLKVSENEAENVAIHIANQNGYTVTSDEVEATGNIIEIKKTVNKQLTFARVLGFSDSDVGAFAKAEILSLIKGEGIIPVAMEDVVYNPGDSYTMHFQAGNPDNSSVNGNFGFLAINGPGGSDLKDGIMHGANREVNEEFEYTKTGLSWGNVKSAFEYRIGQDNTKPHCSSYTTADDTCSRVVTVPIVKTFTGLDGKSKVKIIGFAAFWIESIQPNGNDKSVKGRFIDMYSPGEYGSGENFGISTVKLVN
ncbi:pilus assembly protein TadG-related protein [Lederbergia wuyishanensis]|uniref:Flp pilus assembly protein TadG n=1 Tax=Lederbergia wuyishanensis TaxID=1347903 RepID=A0ABU0D8A5_9BACI|nr:pilus assembly protein TadG-related protein [Lederbergia wuyishanensis]MCJ8009235.1 Tad domain-containing protein [Lederbergia wuyishanensis]MDQ0344632.1 Flp pilus assembly protein TadG [Lederbergia wuyishanensis]